MLKTDGYMYLEGEAMSYELKLAITKIGDLLLEDKITKDNDGEPIDDIKLVIPNYQRPYKWTVKNVIQLLDDIVEAKNENKEIYRVGTLILHEDGEKYNIVDGQQRIITFSLMLKAFGAGRIKFLNQSIADNTDNKRNIPNNYWVLERRVNSIIDDKDKRELLNYIENNCELIVVITDDVSEAFQFFDSQNARGKKLYPHDLLKAYHLREMTDLNEEETEKIVKVWEDLDQKKLSELFSDYLYRIKEWIKGNKAIELTEHNIFKFKGITKQNNFPYAMFYKSAVVYADFINHSSIPFVTGIQNIKPFQIEAPIIAGKPFFDYAKHYFEILKDIQNNDKYAGYYVRDNDIIKTLNLRKYRNGVGNRITRLLLDSTILLYVDKFCPERPAKADSELLEQFVMFSFIWAYSLRAQYVNLGWQSAQNFIIGNEKVKNSFNMYKIITESDSPVALLNILSEMLAPLSLDSIVAETNDLDDINEAGVYKNYLHYFEINKFMESEDEE